MITTVLKLFYDSYYTVEEKVISGEAGKTEQ